MSAEASAAEAAASSEVLDLNADAAVVDSQEHARGADVAVGTKPVEAEAPVEPSTSTRDSAEEGMNSEGRGLSEDGERAVIAEAGDADAAGRTAAGEVAGGREASEGTGADVEGQDDRNGRSAEANACQSAGPEISDGKTEDAVEHVDGTEDADNLSLRADDRIAEGNTESGSGGCSMEVDHVIQETSGLKTDVPVGSEVGVDVGAIQVNSQATNEKDDREDVVAPDLNSAVDIVQSVESENMCPQPAVEKPKGQGNVVMAETNLVTGVENTLTTGETIEAKVHVVTGDSASVAEINLLPTSQASEDQSGDCPTQVDISTDLSDDRGLEAGEKLEDTGENPQGGGDASLIDASLVVKLPSPDQNGDPSLTSTNGDSGTFQVNEADNLLPNKEEKVQAHPEGTAVADDNLKDTECASMSNSGLAAEEHLPESSQLDQNPPGVLKGDLSQVNTSTGQSLSENQITDVQHVGSLLDENQDSQPSLVGGQDVSLSTSADLGTEHESIETGTIPSEEMHGQEVNLNNMEDDGVNLSSDTMENKIAGAGTDVDEMELLAEPLEKEDEEGRSEKCLTVSPVAAGAENKEHASYHLPQEDTKAFFISDLVWGKVKSHPWWPGQIFNPSDASDMALKHQKRDNFLVAYFGDKTFAWCDESKLKPFQACFSQLESQSTSDAFINAVNSALEEVSRRLELGMSCICVPKAVISNLKHQKIENAGIHEGSSCSVVDKSFGMVTFEPNNFLDYIKALALYPCGGMDKLELVIAKAQLMALIRLKCHTQFPASIREETLSENDAVTSPSQRKRSHKALCEHPSPMSPNEEMVASDSSAGKRKKKSQVSALHRQKHIPEHGRKQKSLSELMDDKNYSDFVNGDGAAIAVKFSGKYFAHSSGKKRRKDDSTSPYLGKSKRKRLDALGDLEKKTPTSDRSFKVGECISRVASKLTGSPSIIKCNGESLKKGSAGKADQDSPQVFDVSFYTPEDTRRTRRGILKNHSSPEEMLSQLCLAAKDPMKGYSFLSAIISFFTEVRELRDSGSMVDKRFEKIKKKRGRKKKSESNDDSKSKQSGAHTPSSSVMDEKPSEKIGKKRGRKKKSESKNDLPTDATEASAPDYMTDSYWTDRIVCSTPEEKSQSSRRKRKGELLIQSPIKKTKPSQESLPLSKMLEAAHHLRISAVSPTANRDSAVEKQATFFGEKGLEESTPTALILSFNEPDALPSETNLIRIFSRYGPLKEAETEVLSETNCAKVVFKRLADAEVAFSSAGKYCIFGPALVSYRLRYLPSTSMASPEVRSDTKKETQTLDNVTSETPAEGEVNELVQKEAEALTQEEAKKSARDGVEEFTEEEPKELAQDEVKEICQEAKKLTQEEAEELAQAEVKEFTQEESEELAQDEVKDLTQDEMKDIAQDEEKELTQSEVKDLAQDEGEELTQGEVKVLAQEDVKEFCQEEVKGLAQDEVKEFCQEEVKGLAQDEVKELCQEEVKELAQEETTELAQEEVKELDKEEATELAQEVKELDKEEATELAQEEVKELAQEEATELAHVEEVKELAQEEVKELAQEEVKEPAQGEAEELTQAEAKEE